MDFHLPKIYSATQYRDTLPAHLRSFAPEWQRSSQEAVQPPHIPHKHLRPPMINMPTPCLTFRSAIMLQCRIPPLKCGTSMEQSQQLDRIAATSSKHKVVTSLSGTGDLFEKEAHCQLLALHLACHQTPLNPVVLPALPTDPFGYQRIQLGSSASMLTHRSLVGRCKDEL